MTKKKSAQKPAKPAKPPRVARDAELSYFELTVIFQDQAGAERMQTWLAPAKTGMEAIDLVRKAVVADYEAKPDTLDLIELQSDAKVEGAVMVKETKAKPAPSAGGGNPS